MSNTNQPPRKTPHIKAEQVAKLAGLAHLELDAQECERFAEQIDEIIGYAERIQGLDTADVAPTSHALLQSTQLLRADEPGSDPIDRNALLEAAPRSGDGLFKVPKVLP